MKNRGVDKRLARERVASGCNWLCVPGREYCINDTVKINIARVFDVAFHDMMDKEQQPSTQRLMDYFQTHLRRAVDVTARGVALRLAHSEQVQPELLINLLTHGSVESGTDVSRCAQLHTIGVDGAGLAVVAGLVCRAGAARGARAARRLGGGAPGAARGLCRNAGQSGCGSAGRLRSGTARAKAWATAGRSRVTGVLPEPGAQPAHAGGLRTGARGWFSWSRTILYGQRVGATPNGRHAHTPISHGANPLPGFRKDGAVTAQSTGIASVQPGMGNTAPLQLEFDPKISEEEGGVERIVQLILQHFRLGGTLININVLDGEKLLAAHKDPDLYPDLVVRVTGFTAYFVSLSKQFRQLVVDRFLNGF